MAAAAETTKDPAKTADTFFLKFSLHCLPFKLPDYPEVARTAKKHFLDESMNVDYRYKDSEIIYRMELNKPEDEDQELTFVVEGKSHTIKLEPYRKGNESNKRYQENGLLLTFKNAGTRFYKDIPSPEYDRVLQNVLNLELLKLPIFLPITGASKTPPSVGQVTHSTNLCRPFTFHP